jgi:hypothetical protein
MRDYCAANSFGYRYRHRVPYLFVMFTQALAREAEAVGEAL